MTGKRLAPGHDFGYLDALPRAAGRICAKIRAAFTTKDDDNGRTKTENL